MTLARFPWDVAWAFGLFALSMGNLLLITDIEALARFSAIADRGSIAWLSTLLGWSCIMASARVRLWHVSRIASRGLTLLALFGYGYHLLLLRWPWLIRSSLPGDRLQVYCASLSRSVLGLPLPAFGELLALAVLFTHGALFLIAKMRQRGLFPAPDARSSGPKLVASVAMVLFGLSAWATVNLATGR